MTKKREKGEVRATKRMASPCRNPVISHLGRLVKHSFYSPKYQKL